MVSSCQYTKAIIEDLKESFELDYSRDGYTELNNILMHLDFPLIARENIIGLVRFYDDNCKSVDPTMLIDSLVVKFCSIYRTTVPEEILSSIIDTLPEEYTSLYFNQ